ncbi:MAG: acyltransferase [Clostridia bacterium]|nr:acyltransferase [Clostridia bacterium]
MTKRKSELSLMNILMCMLVILVHTCSWTINSLDKNTVQYTVMFAVWKLSQFVVQGFIFLSAVKLFSSQKPMDYEKFLSGRYKKIVIPYILWIIVYYIYFIRHFGYVFSFSKFGEYVAFGTICSHFYFIVTIMQFYFNMPFFKWLVSKINPWLLSVCSVILTILFKQFVHFQYDDRVFPAYLCYFVIGAIVGKNYEKVCSFVKKFVWLFALLTAVTGYANFYLTHRAVVYGIAFKWLETLHLCYSLSIIFFLLGLFLLVAEGKKLWGFIALMDRASFGMYLSHILYIYIANDIIAKTGITDLFCAYAFRFVFTYTLTFVTCMGYTFIKEKIQNARKTARAVS